MEPVSLILLTPSILLGLTLHEFAHAWTADRLGDPTARHLGRISLNPLRHLDPIGTILLFIVHFGWAKPVPVNPSHFLRPKRDMLLVALAGPGANLLLALIYAFAIRLIPSDPDPFNANLLLFLQLGLIINVSLAVFNLLPIPPLDGSRLIHAVVPDRYEPQYRLFERFGGIALIAVLLIGSIRGVSIIGAVLNPAVNFVLTLFGGV